MHNVAATTEPGSIYATVLARQAIITKAARAAGAKQAGETRAKTKAIRAALAEAFPGAAFKVSPGIAYSNERPFWVEWRDGPEEAAVEFVTVRTGLHVRLRRDESVAVREARVLAQLAAEAAAKISKRLARRLAASILRRRVVAHALRVRACAGVQLGLFA